MSSAIIGTLSGVALTFVYFLGKLHGSRETYAMCNDAIEKTIKKIREEKC